jgi:hypothetical protein
MEYYQAIVLIILDYQRSFKMYKTITTEGVNGVTQQHIIITNSDGSFTSFPVDDTNPTYLAWVSEGNTPEEAD